MPYADPEKRRELVRQWRQKQKPHETPITAEVLKPLTETPAKPLVPETPVEALKRYLSTPCPGMPRLERLQRIAGSLGPKYAKDVWLGAYTMEEIGKVIGTKEALIAK